MQNGPLSKHLMMQKISLEIWILQFLHRISAQMMANDMGVYDLGFYGTGSYSYYAKDKEGEEYGDEEIFASNGLPQEFMNSLTGLISWKAHLHI